MLLLPSDNFECTYLLKRMEQDLISSAYSIYHQPRQVLRPGGALRPHQNGFQVLSAVPLKTSTTTIRPYFPAPSLYFRSGSAAPCPTLNLEVTIFGPWTRYRRLVRPYLIGFSYYTVSASSISCVTLMPGRLTASLLALTVPGTVTKPSENANSGYCLPRLPVRSLFSSSD